jgi:hypothetical protein
MLIAEAAYSDPRLSSAQVEAIVEEVRRVTEPTCDLFPEDAPPTEGTWMVKLIPSFDNGPSYLSWCEI